MCTYARALQFVDKVFIKADFYNEFDKKLLAGKLGNACDHLFLNHAWTWADVTNTHCIDNFICLRHGLLRHAVFVVCSLLVPAWLSEVHVQLLSTCGLRPVPRR